MLWDRRQILEAPRIHRREQGTELPDLQWWTAMEMQLNIRSWLQRGRYTVSHILFHIKSFSALIVQNGYYYSSLKNEVICRPLLFQILKLLQLYLEKGVL